MGDSSMPQSLAQSYQSTKVSYKQLGACGLRLSVPILGAMSFGHKDWANWVVDDEAEVEKLLVGAWERGLNTWDTANVYSAGVSEETIARWGSNVWRGAPLAGRVSLSRAAWRPSRLLVSFATRAAHVQCPQQPRQCPHLHTNWPQWKPHN